jgi:hypothetical protein
VALLPAALLAAALALALAPVATAAPAPLVGTFRLTPGACSSGLSGSYFRMILPSGNASGPFFANKDSACADQTVTPLAPGSDGGLVTGTHQPAPDPGFDGKGNSLAARVIRPVSFVGVRFSASTNAKDLQTGEATRVPELHQDGGRLGGDLSAFDATWNKQSFNQGAPKPNGALPGNTSAPSGTFDAATGRYTLTWTSQIVGGPFDKFTGLWHLEGTFVPAGGGATATTARSATAGGPATAGAAGGSATTAATTATGLAAAPEAGGAAPSPAVDHAPAPDAARDVAATVRDTSFKAPTWLVVLLAVAGIAGVVALLVLGPRPRDAASSKGA